MRQFVYNETCMEKSPILKKTVNNYLIWNEVKSLNAIAYATYFELGEPVF